MVATDDVAEVEDDDDDDDVEEVEEVEEEDPFADEEEEVPGRAAPLVVPILPHFMLE